MSPVAAGGGAQHFLTVYDDSNQSEFDTGLLPAAAACMNKKWRRSWKTPATNHSRVQFLFRSILLIIKIVSSTFKDVRRGVGKILGNLMPQK